MPMIIEVGAGMATCTYTHVPFILCDVLVTAVICYILYRLDRDSK